MNSTLLIALSYLAVFLLGRLYGVFESGKAMKRVMKKHDREPCEKTEATLRKWTIEDSGDFYRIQGQVYGRADIGEGEMIMTSRLKFVDFEGGIAETKNTVYKLEGLVEKQMN